MFGEKFSEENVIEEHRIPVDEYMDVATVGLPDGTVIKDGGQRRFSPSASLGRRRDMRYSDRELTCFNRFC